MCSICTRHRSLHSIIPYDINVMIQETMPLNIPIPYAYHTIPYIMLLNHIAGQALPSIIFLYHTIHCPPHTSHQKHHAINYFYYICCDLSWPYSATFWYLGIELIKYIKCRSATLGLVKDETPLYSCFNTDFKHILNKLWIQQNSAYNNRKCYAIGLRNEKYRWRQTTLNRITICKSRT